MSILSSYTTGGKATGWEHWSTPMSWLEILIKGMGPIGLDPCCNRSSVLYGMLADGHRYALEDGQSGLEECWTGQGMVFENPPYNRMDLWCNKTIVEADLGAEIVGLFPGRIDTEWCHEKVFATVDAYCLWKGRVQFDNPPPQEEGDEDEDEERKNRSTIPNLIPYWGRRKYQFAQTFQKYGEIVIR